MSSDDQEIDWAALRLSQIDVAEMIWSYHQALLGAGFEKNEAMALTICYQQVTLEQGGAG